MNFALQEGFFEYLEVYAMAFSSEHDYFVHADLECSLFCALQRCIETS